MSSNTSGTTTSEVEAVVSGTTKQRAVSDAASDRNQVITRYLPFSEALVTPVPAMTLMVSSPTSSFDKAQRNGSDIDAVSSAATLNGAALSNKVDAQSVVVVTTVDQPLGCVRHQQ